MIRRSDDDPIIAANTLQNHLNKIGLWASKWKIKISTQISVTVLFR